MKYYSYFPGCSAESTGLGLGLSVEAIAGLLDMELAELEDWNCCGSTPYGSLDEEESIAVAARNLALAEKRGLDLVLEGSEPELSDTTAESLVMSIRTHKLLYSGGCEDITDEVMARLDAGK